MENIIDPTEDLDQSFLENDLPTLGTSTNALIDSDFNDAVKAEKSKEIIVKMMQTVMSGNLDKITPFVIGAKDGKIIVEECIVDDNGNIKLPEIKVNTKADLKQKSLFVSRILKEISPVLLSDIEKVTYVALMRKDSKKLKAMLQEVKNGTVKPKLENRVGCIYLIIGDYEVIL